jgi:hypothetical protein
MDPACPVFLHWSDPATSGEDYAEVLARFSTTRSPEQLQEPVLAAVKANRNPRRVTSVDDVLEVLNAAW